MKLKDILVGQAIRFIRLQEPLGGLYVPDFVKAIQERYRFVTVPKSLTDVDRTKGIRFEHGLFKIEGRTIVLDKLLIYNNGLAIDTRTYTEEADLFLDDFITWGLNDLGIRQDVAEPVSKLLLSNVEVEMKDIFPTLRSKTADAIAKTLLKQFSEYGLKVTKPFELTGLTMHIDTAGLQAPIPTNFKLERREGQEYSKNVFFSTAPLQTKDHLELLEQIESSAR